MSKRFKGYAKRNARILERRYDDGSYYEGFWDWLGENWHIYDAVVDVARQTRKAGREHYSMDALCHVVRWQSAIRDKSQKTVKINNNSTSGLARIVMELEPDLKGFFEIRIPPARDTALVGFEDGMD